VVTYSKEPLGIKFRRPSLLFRNLYPSSNITRAIKSRRMKWAGHVACMRETRRKHEILVEKP